MEATSTALILLLIVVLSRWATHLSRLPIPLVQIGLGILVYFSGLRPVQLDPEVFFALLLPPLLFLDGWRIPKQALLKNAPTILTLALGLVVFTVLGLGLLLHALVPAVPLPVAFAFAAVVSPTDPIALSSITTQTPMPARMRHILEGESLFNDASGLVCMRVAVAAALTGAFSLSNALSGFVWVALGGAAIGAALSWLVSQAHAGSSALLGDEGAAQILVTLLIPSGSYLLAEQFHCSGILAAVAAGITVGLSPHTHWDAATRIRRTAIWDMVQFAANGSIFVILGEQIPTILRAASETVRITGHDNPWWLAIYVALVMLTLVVLRLVWVMLTVRSAYALGQLPVDFSAGSKRRVVAAMSLAGVRGAVTLAGVLTLPLTLHNGTGFPGRDLAIFLAAGVILVSLILAAVALPAALRGLEVVAQVDPQVAQNRVRIAAAHAAIDAVESAVQAVGDERPDAPLFAPASARIVEAYQHRIDTFTDDGGSSPQPAAVDNVERELRLVGLRAEREKVLGTGPDLGMEEPAAQELVREIDHQEARDGPKAVE